MLDTILSESVREAAQVDLPRGVASVALWSTLFRRHAVDTVANHSFQGRRALQATRGLLAAPGVALV